MDIGVAPPFGQGNPLGTVLWSISSKTPQISSSSKAWWKRNMDLKFISRCLVWLLGMDRNKIICYFVSLSFHQSFGWYLLYWIVSIVIVLVGSDYSCNVLVLNLL